VEREIGSSRLQVRDVRRLDFAAGPVRTLAHKSRNITSTCQAASKRMRSGAAITSIGIQQMATQIHP
jgi:hypothetical protein